mmetsp:Transcript_22703/g.34044  ORF Transcript_22703/g.34044 Transcript_22703/m.34044 type:complete len:100 (-) Transcript_22703:1817-2116(-)
MVTIVYRAPLTDSTTTPSSDYYARKICNFKTLVYETQYRIRATRRIQNVVYPMKFFHLPRQGPTKVDIVCDHHAELSKRHQQMTVSLEELCTSSYEGAS